MLVREDALHSTDANVLKKRLKRALAQEVFLKEQIAGLDADLQGIHQHYARAISDLEKFHEKEIREYRLGYWNWNWNWNWVWVWVWVFHLNLICSGCFFFSSSSSFLSVVLYC